MIGGAFPADDLMLAVSRLDLLRLVFFETSVRGLMLRAAALLIVSGCGVYLMLPRGRTGGGRYAQRLLGAFLATFSLVLLLIMPLSGPGEEAGRSMAFWRLDAWDLNLTFGVLAAISLASAVLMITSRNPVYSALWFALVLLSNSGLYLLQGAEFLSAATIVIYAGAIIVTFLFVIMLAQPRGTAAYDRVTREPFLSCAAGVLLASALVGTIHHSGRYEGTGLDQSSTYTTRPTTALLAGVRAAAPPSARIEPDRPHVDSLGRTLFLEHVVSIEVIGLLLLAAVAGAILVAGHATQSAGSK